MRQPSVARAAARFGGCGCRHRRDTATLFCPLYFLCESLSNCLLPAAASGSSVDYMYAVNNIVYHLCAPDLQSLSLDNILEQC